MKKLFVCLFSFLIAGYGHASVIYSGPGANGIDTNPATSVSFSVSDHGIIDDLNVAVNIIGGHVEDFVLSIAHNGIEVQLNPFLTAHRDVIDATFDDESSNIIPAGGDLLGDYQSLEMLSAFDGEDTFGVWTLSVLDTFFPSASDTLLSWSIEVNSTSIPEPAIMGMICLGLAGIGASRRVSKSVQR